VTEQLSVMLSPLTTVCGPVTAAVPATSTSRQTQHSLPVTTQCIAISATVYTTQMLYNMQTIHTVNRLLTQALLS